MKKTCYFIETQAVLNHVLIEFNDKSLQIKKTCICSPVANHFNKTDRT
jgi:hypothetical protein